MNLEVQNNQMEDEASSEAFLKTFSKKIKYYESLFISSFPQKVNHKELINYSSINETKYMEFDLSSPDLVSDLSSLTAHLSCRVRELNDDGTVTDLDATTEIGTIPGSIIGNTIRNLRVFLYDTQISPEKSNRYSLLSYMFEYFNKDIKAPKTINYQNGSYFDQSGEESLVTSEAKQVSEALMKAEVASKGYYDSSQMFKESATNYFIDRINSPFLYTKLHLLLPQVRNKPIYSPLTF